MFTGAVLLIPLYRVLRTLDLLNTYWAMIVPGVTFLVRPPTLKRSPFNWNSQPVSMAIHCAAWFCRLSFQA